MRMSIKERMTHFDKMPAPVKKKKAKRYELDDTSVAEQMTCR
jgi:hypothetical protein